ncbi:MAG: hypothetical protein TECD_01181 [Hyphomicrobiaceae bacterium hypho_1]
MISFFENLYLVLSKKKFKSVTASKLAILLIFLAIPSGFTQQATKSYDQKLYRLSELLGAIHYLRELCASNDGQKWRRNMQELINAEGTSSNRKEIMSHQFNRGYRSLSKIYPHCTNQAKKTINDFIKDSIKTTDDLIVLYK